MAEPTIKQIKFAKSLGIENPEEYDGKALSEEIKKKLPDKPVNASNGHSSRGSEGKHDIVITRTEKPHSYEFGKASRRHKIYYGEVEELQAHIKALREANLIDLEDEVEHIKAG